MYAHLYINNQSAIKSSAVDIFGCISCVGPVVKPRLELNAMQSGCLLIIMLYCRMMSRLNPYE